MPSSLQLHAEGGVVRLELVSPEGYPRLSTALLEELEARFCSLLPDSTCQGIVLHGTDKCFAAGAEIAEVRALNGITALEFARRTQRLFEMIANSSKPVVAAVAGYCLGGGFDLALACHWRLATPAAIFGHPGATLGLLTGWGGTQRLPRLIGRGRALELLLSGATVDAAQALRLGVVDEVVTAQNLLARARERAHSKVAAARTLV